MMQLIRRAATVVLGAAMIGWAAAPSPARSADASVPILLYHRFSPSVPGSTTVTTPAFEEQLAWLADHHYTVARLASVVAALRGGAPLDPTTVAITVDDGRRSQYTEMFPIVLHYKVPVTLFVYTDAVSFEPDALTWAEIEEMLQSGLVDVQSHTCSHPDFDKERAPQRGRLRILRRRGARAVEEDARGAPEEAGRVSRLALRRRRPRSRARRRRGRLRRGVRRRRPPGARRRRPLRHTAPRGLRCGSRREVREAAGRRRRSPRRERSARLLPSPRRGAGSRALKDRRPA